MTLALQDTASNHQGARREEGKAPRQTAAAEARHVAGTTLALASRRHAMRTSSRLWPASDCLLASCSALVTRSSSSRCRSSCPRVRVEGRKSVSERANERAGGRKVGRRSTWQKKGSATWKESCLR